MKLSINLVQMPVHRARADAKLIGNLLVWQALGQKREDSLLAFREPIALSPHLDLQPITSLRVNEDAVGSTGPARLVQ